MTYWSSHGRLRVVLVFTQRYAVLLSIGSSGTSTLTTVLGTQSGRGLVVFKGMPNVCVRHLGLLGLSESSRLHPSPLSPSVITFTLRIVLTLVVAQVYTPTLLLSGTYFDQASVSPSVAQVGTRSTRALH